MLNSLQTSFLRLSSFLKLRSLDPVRGLEELPVPGVRRRLPVKAELWRSRSDNIVLMDKKVSSGIEQKGQEPESSGG